MRDLKSGDIVGAYRILPPRDALKAGRFADPEEIARALLVLASHDAVRADFSARGLANVSRFRRADVARGVKDEIRTVAGLMSRRELCHVGATTGD